MQLHYWWWILAVGLGVLEILTGTFYLLVFAVGCAAGGLAAWAGAGLTVQVLITAAVTIVGWGWLWRRSPWRQTSGGAGDANMMLDVGERLQVEAWGADRRAQVRYRGAAWSVELDPAEPASSAVPGQFVIRRVVGSRLVVQRAD
ncbi:MAG: NfeD family protein [Burkholderiales bacterium]|nr:MAG: NfeD family protein [Burkholderiales bacterium]